MVTRPAIRKRHKGEQAPASADEGTRVRHPVYEHIKADILSLALPPGHDLDEVSLSRRYGVSRTPVREALIRLSSEHLVELSQSRARVSALILADYPRFIEALDLTRRAIARLAATRRHETDLAKIAATEAAFARAAKAAKTANDAFARTLGPLETDLHIAIAEAGHNRYLTQSYGRLLTVGHRMLHLPYAYDPQQGTPLPAFIRSVISCHRRLLAAIEARDGTAAEAEAGVLTATLVARLRAYLEENLASSVSIQSGSSRHAGTTPEPEMELYSLTTGQEH